MNKITIEEHRLITKFLYKLWGTRYAECGCTRWTIRHLDKKCSHGAIMRIARRVRRAVQHKSEDIDTTLCGMRDITLKVTANWPDVTCSICVDRY